MGIQMRFLISLFFICVALTACQSVTTKEETEKKGKAAKVNVQLGMNYLQNKDMPRAKQKLLLALKQDPKLPEAWYAMGYFLETTSNPEQAKQHYLTAIKISNNRGDSLNNYGTFLCRSGDYQGAITQFLKATKDPNYIDVGNAYENAGLCALKIPDAKRAKEFFNKALAENPNLPSALLELADLNYKLGQLSVTRHQLDLYLQIGAPSIRTYNLERDIDTKLAKKDA